MSRPVHKPVCYKFGDFEFQPARRQLLARGQPVLLGARALDVLTALVERYDRVVGKSELLDIVWPGLVVEENNVQVQISALRKLLGPNAVTTNPGRGYQFTAAFDETPFAPTPGVSEAIAVKREQEAPASLEPPALIGRDEDLCALCELIMHRSTVTLVGAGGIGKTSLALAVAHRIRDRFRDGACIVELTGEHAEADLPQTVARALRIPVAGAASALGQLVGALSSQHLLLVLDNCEHVCRDACVLVQALSERARGVRVLVTSQEMLHAHCETLFRLGPLQTPPAGEPSDPERFGAVRLFRELACRVQNGFALTATNTAAVCEICRRLDGLPLAIELAAARVRVLGVSGILERLDDRFKILTGGARTAVPRHQTLAATIDWSHDLLAAEEQRTLRRLGVFVGGFSLGLAQAVVSDDTLSEWAVIDTVSALIDKSFVLCEPGDVQRYRLLESTRAYALERLEAAGERPAIERRRALALRDFLLLTDEQRFADADTLTFDAMMARLTPEYHNVRAAFDWAAGRDGDVSIAIDLVADSVELFRGLGQAGEAFERARPLMTQVDASSDAYAVARFLSALGFLGDVGRMTCEEQLEASSRAADWFQASGYRRRACRALYRVGWTLMVTNRYAEADVVATQMQAQIAESDPVWLRADLLNLRASMLIRPSHFEAAVELFHEQRELLARRDGESRLVQRSVNNLCSALNCLGRFEEVVAILDSAGETASRDLLATFGYADLQLLHAQTMLGRLAEARKTVQRAMPRWQRDGLLLFGCPQLAMLLAACGRHADAARLEGAGQAYIEKSGLSPTATRVTVTQHLARLLSDARIEPAALERWRQEGRKLGPTEVALLCLAAGP
jgi:predicted ATPase/DNA-binding winged helix-turn-helix (wHTH) protein